MYDVVTPEIRSPRDVHRLINTLSVSWKAVAGEVDPVDFLCMETLRVQRPKIYASLRSNKARLTNSGMDHSGHNNESVSNLYDDIFLTDLVGEEKDNIKGALRRLFPALDGIWGNTSYASDFFGEWEEQRRVCSENHFETYFRFSLSEHNISMKEVKALVQNCGEAELIKDTLLAAKETPNGQGGTRAASLLDELNIHAKKIPLEKATGFLAGIFSAYDEIDTAADEARGFSYANNRLRIHWVMRSVTRNRTSLEERSKIIVEAAEASSVGWLAELAWSAYDDYHPREGKSLESEENCITTQSDAAKLQNMALVSIENSATDGSLLTYRGLVRVLYHWDRLSGNEDHKKAREWCVAQIENDVAIERFADAFVSTSWTQGMGGFGGSLGDTVAIRKESVSKSLEDFFEPNIFIQRVEKLRAKLSKDAPGYSTLSRFLSARESNDDW